MHHGYVATAKSFSNWSHFSKLTKADDKKSGVLENIGNNKISSDQTKLCNNDNQMDSKLSVQRRHSDSSCVSSFSIDTNAKNQFPGIASMLHRRRLRALCKRCQYGKAAATLNRLYPQVLEKCPELLVQLRCRQLIEMVGVLNILVFFNV